MAPQRGMHIIVITVPERLDQQWIARLGDEADVARIERVGVLNAGFEMAQQSRPDLVIVDRDVEQAETFIRQIFTTLPGTLCLAVVGQIDTATLRRLVAVGARDVLPRPVQYAELITSVRSIMETEANRRSRSLVPLAGGGMSTGHRGKLIVVTSPKGGSGTTTIATNLAIALQQASNSRVLLADFCLQFGDVGVQLNLWSKHTMLDLLANVDDIDDSVLKTVLQTHGSGLQVLFAPNMPEAAGEVTGEQVEKMLDVLLTRFDYIVADTWSFIDEISITLLKRATEVLVVSTPEVPSLKNVKRFLEFVQREVEMSASMTLVLNRFPSVDGISLEDVKQHLRHPVGANIPSEGRLVTHSVNRGVPVVMSHPQSWVGQSLLKLAAKVAGEQVNTITLTPDQARATTQTQQRPRGLFGMLRRD